jgi:hypothetical protein
MFSRERVVPPDAAALYSVLRRAQELTNQDFFTFRSYAELPGKAVGIADRAIRRFALQSTALGPLSLFGSAFMVASYNPVMMNEALSRFIANQMVDIFRGFADYALISVYPPNLFSLRLLKHASVAGLMTACGYTYQRFVPDSYKAFFNNTPVVSWLHQLTYMSRDLGALAGGMFIPSMLAEAVADNIIALDSPWISRYALTFKLAASVYVSAKVAATAYVAIANFRERLRASAARVKQLFIQDPVAAKTAAVAYTAAARDVSDQVTQLQEEVAAGLNTDRTYYRQAFFWSLNVVTFLRNLVALITLGFLWHKLSQLR